MSSASKAHDEVNASKNKNVQQDNRFNFKINEPVCLKQQIFTDDFLDFFLARVPETYKLKPLFFIESVDADTLETSDLHEYVTMNIVTCSMQ